VKIYFSLFNNNGDRAHETKFRKYKNKSDFEEVVADYRITNAEKTVSGSAIKDRSKAGHSVIRLNFGVKRGDGRTVYYSGTLNIANNKKKDNAPDMFGSATDRDGQEMDLSCWVKQDKNGNKFLSCNMQEPYKDGGAEPVPETEDDDLPF